MALYHFYWQGRERSVAINTIESGATVLRFIDPQLIELGLSRLVLEEGITLNGLLHENNALSPVDRAELLQSLKAVVPQL